MWLLRLLIVVIQDDSPSKVAAAVRIARYTRRIVWQNIGLALGIKLLVLLLGAGGYATLWEAVFADVGVALLAIGNAVRIQYKNFICNFVVSLLWIYGNEQFYLDKIVLEGDKAYCYAYFDIENYVEMQRAVSLTDLEMNWIRLISPPFSVPSPYSFPGI